MSDSLVASSKLQFYPTHVQETYRIAGVLSSRPWIEHKFNHQEFRDEFGLDKYKQLFEYHIELETQNRKVYDFEAIKYESMLADGRYDLINKYIKCDIGFSGGITIADLFAGKGKWLHLFRQLSDKKNILIGNELEYNRYQEMIEDGLIDIHYNKAFEDLQLPKRIINIMLFNPPYNTSNNEQNVRRYLRMILEREVMTKDSVLVMVVKKRDALLCVDLLAKYFHYDVLCYKTHPIEYEKWGQVVLFAKMRDEKLNTDNINELAKYKQCKDTIEAIINQDKEFNIEDYKYLRYHSFKNPDIKMAFENFKFTKNQNKHISSKNDKAWKWLIKDTEFKDLSTELITIPKNLKSGELANVIASGKINGELSLNDGSAKHVAVGGVKSVKDVRQITTEDKSGKESIKLQTTIQSVPYLNILIKEEGKYKIKELKAGGDSNDSVSTN